MAVFVNLPALHRLGVARRDAASELPHRAERLRQQLDAKVRVLLRPLLERGDELVHLALRLLILEREQHPRLDVHQMCRHCDELARDLEIELLSLLEIGEVLVQDERDGNVLNFYFIFRQQEEDEVQRSLKVLQRFRAALVDHALQLENGIVHSLHLNTIRFIRKEYT